MCSVKAPKAPAAPEQKPVQYLSNVWLDGTGVSQNVVSRNSLRMDLGSASQRLPVTTPGTPQVPPTAPADPSGSPSRGIGMGGGTRRVSSPWQTL